MYTIFQKDYWEGSEKECGVVTDPMILAGYLKSLPPWDLQFSIVVKEDDQCEVWGNEWLDMYPDIAQKALTVGDTVLNPKTHNENCCVVSSIVLQKNGPGHVTLRPITRYGWPSKNRDLFQGYRLEALLNLKPMSKEGSLKMIKGCPDCLTLNESFDPYMVFKFPMRKKDICSDEYQCQGCKKWFEIKD